MTTTNTTASIDLAQLDKLENIVRRAYMANEVVAMVPPAKMLDVITLARRSLTSGAPAGLLNAEELAALRRFDECAQDGEGYDVPKEMMTRLAEIGVLRRRSGAYYQTTEFGMRVLAAPVHDAAAPSNEQALADMEARKDAAYYERNQVVAALAKCFPSGVARTAIEGWSKDWHGCVYIDLPTGQVSWHFHDSQAHLFAGLPPYAGKWDGHDTTEKYRRVGALEVSAGAAAKTDHALREAVRAITLLIKNREWADVLGMDADATALWDAVGGMVDEHNSRATAAGAGSDQADTQLLDRLQSVIGEVNYLDWRWLEDARKFGVRTTIEKALTAHAVMVWPEGLEPSPSVTVQDERALSFDAWWMAEVDANDGESIGADYRHWAKKGYYAAHPVQDGEKDAKGEQRADQA